MEYFVDSRTKAFLGIADIFNRVAPNASRKDWDEMAKAIQNYASMRGGK